MDVCVSRPRGERLLGISLSSERTSANGLLLTFPDTDMGKKKRTSLQGTARVAQSLREAINNLGNYQLVSAPDLTQDDDRSTSDNMWSPVPTPSEAKVPSSRSKHAAVLHGQFLYLLGGRNGNVPMKDFWKYNIAENTWEQIQGKGNPPGCLQEHTMVGYRDTLYVFGGEVGFSNGVETPLWMYNIKENSWRKFVASKGVVTPKGRRSHTATVFQDSMFIYGGYQDLKGSTSELWAFHYASETWHLVSQGGAVDGPPPRHRHSAVLHDSAMWVFGGMTDLQERSDFWRFDFVSRRWRPVKSRPGPGCLHSHCAVKFLSVMMIFGGEREGQTLNEMWRFHFATEFWEKLSFVNCQPMPRAQTTAFIFSQFTTRGTVHYMGLPEQDYFGSQPEPSCHQKCSSLRDPSPTQSSSSRLSVTKCALPRVTSSPSKESLIQNDSPEVGKKYSFAVADSCLDDLSNCVEQIPRDFFLRRGNTGNNFQRLDATGRPNNSNNLFKDIAKISQFSLARLSQYYSYSTFSNESTESLNTASSTASPCSVRMAKSRSSQQFINTALMKDSATPVNSDESLPRDQKSVPNFASLQKSASLEETTDAKAVLEKAKDQLETSVLTSSSSEQYGTKPQLDKDASDHLSDSSCSSPTIGMSKGQTVARSDSAYTFQSYDCSSRSSTLSSQASSTSNGVHKAAREQLSYHQRLHKSSSVNRGFCGDVRLLDLEEEAAAAAFYSSDEFSSLSGYESTEAVDSADELNNRTGFSNPHYLSPDVQAMVERKQANRTNYLLRNDSHQSFAQALNSPADSLFSDFQDFHSRLNQGFVELHSYSKQQVPSAAASWLKSPAVITSTLAEDTRANAEEETVPNIEESQDHPAFDEVVDRVSKGCRPVSADVFPENKVAPIDQSRQQQQLTLLMYIVGGREVGQVTVFKRPISVWRLDLTKTF